MNPLDVRLMVVIRIDSTPWKERLQDLIEGGVTVVQFRHKGPIFPEDIERLNKLSEFLREKKIPLIVNDLLGLALKIKADGVHVGERDLKPNLIREQLGPHRHVGLSLSSLQSMKVYGPHTVTAARPDYFGIGPIFPTSNKLDAAPALGVQGLKNLLIAERQYIESTPVIVIGGITQDNLSEVLIPGISGIAAIGSLWHAPDPYKTAQYFRQKIDQHLLLQGIPDPS